MQDGNQFVGRRFQLRVPPLDGLDGFPIQLCPPSGKVLDLSTNGRTGQQSIVWQSFSTTGFVSHSNESLDSLAVQIPFRGHFMQRMGSQELLAKEGVGLLSKVRPENQMYSSPDFIVLGCVFDNDPLSMAYGAMFDPSESLSPDFLQFADMHQLGLRALQRALVQVVFWEDAPGGQIDTMYPLMEELLIFQLIGCWPMANTISSKFETAPSHILMRATDYIDANLGRSLTVVEVAKAAGASVRTLQKLFRSRLGCSPVQYIIDQRLIRVHHDLVREGDVTPVSQIAYRWGFVHLSDFSRRFKAKFGKRPSDIVPRSAI
ncbi:AraC-type DNA-binding protein [Cohaesibacter sp. ES.047]|nr:AraC-type DNA-binding protein [Cohaesibacter sp. ES.047]